jgi:hypothetical protein
MLIKMHKVQPNNNMVSIITDYKTIFKLIK